MNTYTDPRLLAVAGALDVLPALPVRRAKALIFSGCESHSAKGCSSRYWTRPTRKPEAEQSWRQRSG